MKETRTSVILALLLGSVGTYAFTSTDAVGYPAGPTISHGSNPVVNYGGTMYDFGDVLLFTAPDDQAVVITDVMLTAGNEYSQCRGLEHIALVKGSDSMAEFHIGLSWRYTSGTSYVNTVYDSQVIAHFASGLRVPPGESLTMDGARIWSDSCGSGIDVAYAISGYLAQP